MRNTKNYIFVLILILISTTISAQTANPNANQKTKEVLQYLSNLKNKNNNKLLLGQDLGHGSSMLGGYNNYVSELRNQTGKWIGMIGGDYGLDGNHNVYQTNQLLIDYWNDGGLVTLSWHFDNPWTGGDSWDTYNGENLWELTDPNNGMYNVWRAQLAEVANALRPLRDAGVTVLWRPLHEMNGDWFWWGEKYWNGHEEAYKNLYINMFNYLTYEQGMDNLLWVYSVGNTYYRTLTNYYPGSQYVDVVGMDLYDDNANTYDPSREYQDMKSLGHPMGFTEFGPTISTAYGNYDYRRMVNNIKSKYPDFVFSYAWHSWPGANIAYADNQYTWNTFADSWVITRDEINLNEGGGGSGILPEGRYRLYCKWGDLRLNGNNVNWSETRVAPWNDSWTSQIWHLERVSGNTYRLRNDWTGLYLSGEEASWGTVKSGSFNASYTSMMWTLEDAGASNYRLRCNWGGQYLNGENSNWAVVKNGPLNTSWLSQQWYLEPVSSNKVGQDTTPHITLAPNPSPGGAFRLDILNEDLSEKTVSIYNVQGQEVFRQIINTPTINADLIPGVYYVYVEMAQGTFIEKLVVY